GKSGDGAQQVVITYRELAPLLGPPRQVPQLHAQDARLDGVEPSVIALNSMRILVTLAMITQHANFGRNRRIVGGHRPGLAAGAEVFTRVKAEGRGIAQRAGLLPAVVPTREVG